MRSRKIARTAPSQTIWSNPKIIPYLFIAPNMILFMVFMIVPILMTFGYSLTKWSGMGPPRFVGLRNYLYILKDEVFLRSLLNTLAFSAATVPFLMTLALFFAVLLNQPLRLKGFFRSALYLPSVISTVVTGMVFLWLFESQVGLINYLFTSNGLKAVEWNNDPRYAMVMVVVGTIWARTGYNMVIYLAALQGIPPEYYEAAKIDGASGLQVFWHVTLPLLKPTHLFVMITCVIHSFRSFDLIYVMTKGGPLNATKTLVVYVYDTAFSMNYYGRAAAGGVILFLILLVFTMIRIKMERESGQ